MAAMDLGDFMATMDFGDIIPYIKKIDEGYLATLCSEADAEMTTIRNAGEDFGAKSYKPGTKAFFRFQQYDDAQKASFLEQASSWRVMVHYVEERLPPWGCSGETERIEQTHYSELEPEMILVEDGKFAGAITYSGYLTGSYKIFHAPISDYRGQPLFLAEHDSAFLSGPEYYTTKKYLVNLADIDQE